MRFSIKFFEIMLLCILSILCLELPYLIFNIHAVEDRQREIHEEYMYGVKQLLEIDSLQNFCDSSLVPVLDKYGINGRSNREGEE